ncbi:hypothetical protein PT286_10090 [Neisseriaceae bacterium ESL0693]|nr:hypothetical protein [Neisseriaceae bacterium ESL0693]
MTTTKTKFNELRDAIMLAAKQQGISEEELHGNLDKWHMDYKDNLDRDFKYTINDLNENTKLFKQAIERKDMVTAIVALVYIEIQTHELRNFFENINDDLIQLGWGEKLKEKWPDIPEDYQVPPDYDYENTNLTCLERREKWAKFDLEEDRLDELEQRPKVLTMHKKTPLDQTDD